MKIIPCWRSSKYLARVGIFLIITALITGIPVSYGVAGDDNQPSQNLEIYTWYDLDAVRDNLDGAHVLMNDLNATTPGYTLLASPTANGGKGWNPIGYSILEGGGCQSGGMIDYCLDGTFDGQGHKICDLFINRPTEYEVGIFYSNGGSIMNLGVTNFTVTGYGVVGSLVGSNHGRVINSYSSGNVTGESTVGGLVGSNQGYVSDSYSTGNVNGSSSVGGLVGVNSERVNHSCSTGNVIGVDDVGGLVGWNREGTMSNSYATGSVTGVENVGGLVGNNGEGYMVSVATVHNSYSTGNVKGKKKVGGLVGNNYGTNTVSNSYSTGNVIGVDDVGGLVGRSGWGRIEYGQAKEMGGTVRDSYSTGNVNGNQFVGGLVGYTIGTVSNSYSTGNVTGYSSVGGLVGISKGIMRYSEENLVSTVSDSYSTGNVNGNRFVGGLVGDNDGGTVNNSYSIGNVTGYSSVGGVVGISKGMMRYLEGSLVSTVSDSYSTGNVNGNRFVGGLVGTSETYSNVRNSYSTGNVNGDEYVGGLVGYCNYCTVIKSFWNIETSGQASSDGGTGKTTQQMNNIATFSVAGWNIIAVALNETNSDYLWNIVNNMTYPFLSWES